MGAKIMNEDQERLIAEQFSHALDLLKAENTLLMHRVQQLESQVTDHEARLRSATDGVTQFKVWSGLSSGASSIIAIIALVRATVGGG
jgi:hypothetical protein